MQVSRGGVLNSVTVRTVKSEPRRGSLSDRVLIAEKPVRRSFRFNRVTGNQDRDCTVCVGRGVLPFHPPGRMLTPSLFGQAETTIAPRSDFTESL